MRGQHFAIILLILVVGGYFYWHITRDTLTRADKRLLPLVNEPSSASKSGSTPLATDQAATTDRQDSLQQQAQRYVEEITTHDDGTVAVDSADDFVNLDEPISLFANKTFEFQTLQQLQGQHKPDAPLTIVREQDQVEIVSSKELIADAGGQLDKPVKILTGGNIHTMTVGKIIEQHPDLDSPLSIIRKIENLEVTTLRELKNNNTLAMDTPLKVIREPYSLQTTTVNELLMGEKTLAEHSIFYVRNITSKDIQGLWGVVHNGLVRNFASGIAIRRDQEIRNYQVEIPTNADERLEDDSSSFLGRMIDRKTRSSYVYNYEHGTMGRNPDIVHAGQEIVIIGFTPEELYKIYEHFVTRSESRS